MGDTVVAEAVVGGGRDTPISVEAIASKETAPERVKGGKLEMELLPGAKEDFKMWVSPDGKTSLVATHTELGVVISLNNGSSCRVVINGNGMYPFGDCGDLTQLCQRYVMKDPYFGPRIMEYM